MRPALPEPTKASVTPKVAAGLLGVTVRTVRRLIRSGKLEAFNVGRAVRIRRAEVARYITANGTRDRF